MGECVFVQASVDTCIHMGTAFFRRKFRIILVFGKGDAVLQERVALQWNCTPRPRCLGLGDVFLGDSRVFTSASLSCGGRAGVDVPDGHPAAVQHGGRLRGAAADGQHADQNGTCPSAP